MTPQQLAKLFPEQADAILGNSKPVKPSQLDREVANQKREALERLFLATWRIVAQAQGLPEPVQQYQFDEVRKYRFDFAFVDRLLAIELHGGQWINGGHNRGSGQQKDVEKKRLAISQGWYVLEYTTEDLKNPVQVIEQVVNIYRKINS